VYLKNAELSALRNYRAVYSVPSFMRRCESAMEIENEVSQAARTINNGVYGTRETKLCSPHTQTGRISAWV